MKPEQFVLDVKNNTLKPYYVLAGANKYVIDEYVKYATKEPCVAVSANEAYTMLCTDSLLSNDSKFVVCKVENEGEAESLASAKSDKCLIMLTETQTGLENEICFAKDAGTYHIQKQLRKDSMKFPLKECVEQYDLQKAVVEISKQKLLTQANVPYAQDDIVPLDDSFYIGFEIFELKIIPALKSKDMDERLFAKDFKQKVLCLLRVHDVMDLPASKAVQVAGLKSERQFYFFRRYAKQYSKHQLLELYFYADSLAFVQSPNNSIKDLLLCKLYEVRTQGASKKGQARGV